MPHAFPMHTTQGWIQEGAPILSTKISLTKELGLGLGLGLVMRIYIIMVVTPSPCRPCCMYTVHLKLLKCSISILGSPITQRIEDFSDRHIATGTCNRHPADCRNLATDIQIGLGEINYAGIILGIIGVPEHQA